MKVIEKKINWHREFDKNISLECALVWYHFLLVVFSPAELLMSTDSADTKRNSSMIVQALVYYILPL